MDHYNLTSADKVTIVNRELNHLIDDPFYYAHSSNETLIDIRFPADNPQAIFACFWG